MYQGITDDEGLLPRNEYTGTGSQVLTNDRKDVITFQFRYPSLYSTNQIGIIKKIDFIVGSS